MQGACSERAGSLERTQKALPDPYSIPLQDTGGKRSAAWPWQTIGLAHASVTLFSLQHRSCTRQEPWRAGKEKSPDPL